jgi:copper(I)-binding protein
MRSSLLVLGAALLLATGTAVAHDSKHGALRLMHPHANPVDEGGTTELTLSISNDGAPDRLVAIETEMAKKVELKPVQIPSKAKNLVVKAKLVGATRTYLDTEMVSATFVFAKAGRVVEDIMVDK